MNTKKRKKSKLGNTVSLWMILNQMKRRECWSTLAENNEAIKLELPRAWKLLDSSKPS